MEKKNLIAFTTRFSMAQEQGFEPWHRVTDLRAFQARPFNRLGIPANILDDAYV